MDLDSAVLIPITAACKPPAVTWRSLLTEAHRTTSSTETTKPDALFTSPTNQVHNSYEQTEH